MLKVLVPAVTTVLLLSFTSCTKQSEPQSNVAPTVATNKSSPAVATPTSKPTAPMTASVKASNFKWQDDASGTPVTTIKVGGTVTWTNTEGNHSLERVAGSPDNGCDNLDDTFNSDLNEGQPVSRTFTKVGTFGYHCGIHKGTPSCKNPPGGAPGRMPGVIKVVP